MKKVLTLILVLGMASAASAALQISVHSPSGGGTWDPLDPQPTDIVIRVSDELILDVHTDAEMSDDIYWVLYTQIAGGTITGGNALDWGPEIDNGIFGSAVENVVPLQAGEEGVVGGTFLWSTDVIPASGMFADGILFHCNELGDTTVILQEVTSSWGMGAILDTVVIHQIPEPMTMALLGLGGLALIRRRR
jgi:hypothetical protein